MGEMIKFWIAKVLVEFGAFIGILVLIFVAVFVLQSISLPRSGK